MLLAGCDSIDALVGFHNILSLSATFTLLNFVKL